MSLKAQLLEDMKTAMREKDDITKNAIQMVRSAVLQIEKDKKITLDDDGIIDVIAKEVKKKKESLPGFEKSGRQDLIDILNKEIEILSGYLPQQLTETELEELVKNTINETGFSSVKDTGKLMKQLMPLIRGRADGKLLNQIVKKFLS